MNKDRKAKLDKIMNWIDSDLCNIIELGITVLGQIQSELGDKEYIFDYVKGKQENGYKWKVPEIIHGKAYNRYSSVKYIIDQWE